MIKLISMFAYFKILLVVIVLSLLGILFSYRLLDVPSGLTGDEAAFGYNAVLLSRDGHDQNGNFLPIFVLSLDGRDWRQPVTQYYITAFFKIFGASVFNLRLSSVAITLLSAALLFFLARSLLNQTAAIFASAVFLLTPLVMIQSHMGLDNIMTIPFTVVWLWGLVLFSRNHRRRHLALAAVALGVGFYTYKGMRAIVPVWTILTLFYLFSSSQGNPKPLTRTIKDLLVFGLLILPFFAVIPSLENRYPGAVFDRLQPSWTSAYDLVYSYLSSFDLTFLFIKGDATPYHSTGKHGMMLLATLPLFLIGCYQSVRKKNIWLLVLLAFFTAPLLYGLANTAHRASRLMPLIPPYSLLATLGAATLWEYRKKFWNKALLLALVILMIMNYFDFANYYWFTYSKATENIFGNLQQYRSYEALAGEATKKRLLPYISADLLDGHQADQLFFESIYLLSGARVIEEKQLPPPGSILLTNYGEVPEMEKIDLQLPFYYLHIRR